MEILLYMNEIYHIFFLYKMADRLIEIERRTKNYLKGLAMIFAGQENSFIIFRNKKIYIYFKTNNKISINLLKTCFLVSFILEETLTVFLIS